MDKSAGIIIILNNKKVLLAHPTNSRWTNTYSFPKGGIEEGESQIDAAIREFKEETSIEVSIDKIEDKIQQKIRKKKVLCKNVIARQRDQTHVHSKEVFSSHKISSKKHANQIIISESFSESYFDLLFNENFVTAASNTIIKKDNSKNQKITKSKKIAEKKKEEKT